MNLLYQSTFVILQIYICNTPNVKQNLANCDILRLSPFKTRWLVFFRKKNNIAIHTFFNVALKGEN